MEPGTELDELRSKVREADVAMLDALDRRFRLARRIGSAKAETGRPLRNYSVEDDVVARWRGRLDASGIPSDRSEALAQWIIEESLRVQEEAFERPPPRPGAAFDVAIVGGAGAMGCWLGDFLEDGGYRVAVVDPKGAPRGRLVLPDLESAVRAAETVVFATPVRQTAPLLRRALAVPSHALILDVLSVTSSPELVRGLPSRFIVLPPKREAVPASSTGLAAPRGAAEVPSPQASIPRCPRVLRAGRVRGRFSPRSRPGRSGGRTDTRTCGPGA